MAVLLNIDAGELDDEAEELYVLAHLVNIACGGHAGDPRTMDRVLASCAHAGTLAGAHPSYPDREGFGRRAMKMQPDEIAESVASQCEALAERARRVGLRVTHVKANGALYHAANGDPAIAKAVVEGATRALGSVVFVGPATGEIARAAGGILRERFCDRAERPDGTLVPRSEPGALVTDPELCAARAREFLREKSADTVCVHGDTPGAVQIARAVREALDRVQE
jgi:UPF0271 protein